MLEALKTLIKISQFRKYPPEPSESLGNWAERALGKPMAEKIVAPGVLGIYAADSKDLSANLIVGRFFEKVKRRNIRGKIKGTVSAQEGLGALLQSLRMTLSSRGVIFEFGADGGEALRRAGQNKTPAVLATSAWAACEILRSQQRVAREDLRIKALSEIRSIPLISVTVFFRTPPDKVGFGTLFAQNLPVGENDGILGCLQNSEIFEGRVRGESATHSETWILGGVSRGVELIELADAALLEMIILKRSKMIDPDSREKIVDTRFTRWPRAIPLYSPSLEAAVPLLKVDREGVLLFGNYLGELGLASILENSIELKSRLEKL